MCKASVLSENRMKIWNWNFETIKLNNFLASLIRIIPVPGARKTQYTQEQIVFRWAEGQKSVMNSLFEPSENESLNEKLPVFVYFFSPLMSRWCFVILEVQAKTGSFSQTSVGYVQAPLHQSLSYTKNTTTNVSWCIWTTEILPRA